MFRNGAATFIYSESHWGSHSCWRYTGLFVEDMKEKSCIFIDKEALTQGVLENVKRKIDEMCYMLVHLTIKCITPGG